MKVSSLISYTEEFLKLYVDTLPSDRWNVTPHSLNVG